MASILILVLLSFWFLLGLKFEFDEENQNYIIKGPPPQSADIEVQILTVRHTKLEQVSISSWSFSDSGFLALVSLKNLQLLELTNSSITGEDIGPVENHVTCLKTLNLSDNLYLTDEGTNRILDIFGETLESLNLSNSLDVTVIKNPLPMLKELLLKALNIDELGELLSRVGNNLTVLDLSESDITGDEFTTPLPNLNSLSLNSCRCLKKLDLGLLGPGLTKVGLGSECALPVSLKVSLVKKQKMLEDLEVHFDQGTEFPDIYFSDMLKSSGAKLRLLKLHSDTGLTGECFTTLEKNLSNVQDLEICSSSIDESNFNNLMRIVGGSVKRLKLADLKCSGSQLNLSNITLSQIEYLCFEYCETLTDSVISIIIGNCGPKLTKLDVNSAKFSGDLLLKYQAKFPQLDSLRVAGCDALSSTGVCAMLRMAGSNLKDVKLSRANFTGSGLSEFSESLLNLESLTIDSCPFTDKGFLELFSHGTSNVRSLELKKTAMTGGGLRGSSITFPQISRLNLGNSYQLMTSEGVLNILKMCGQRLKSVFAHPNLISSETKTLMKERRIANRNRHR